MEMVWSCWLLALTPTAFTSIIIIKNNSSVLYVVGIIQHLHRTEKELNIPGDWPKNTIYN